MKLGITDRWVLETSTGELITHDTQMLIDAITYVDSIGKNKWLETILPNGTRITYYDHQIWFYTQNKTYMCEYYYHYLRSKIESIRYNDNKYQVEINDMSIHTDTTALFRMTQALVNSYHTDHFIMEYGCLKLTVSEEKHKVRFRIQNVSQNIGTSVTLPIFMFKEPIDEHI